MLGELDLPQRAGELKQGTDPTQGNCLRQRRTFKAESETADLWQPKRNENETVLAAATCILDRNAGLLEGVAAGHCSLGIVVQSQGESCY